MDYRNKWLRRYLIVSPLVVWGLVCLLANMFWWTAFPVYGWQVSVPQLVGFTGFISVYSAVIICLCCLQIERRLRWLNVWFVIVIAVHLITLVWPAGEVVRWAG